MRSLIAFVLACLLVSSGSALAAPREPQIWFAPEDFFGADVSRWPRALTLYASAFDDLQLPEACNAVDDRASVLKPWMPLEVWSRYAVLRRSPTFGDHPDLRSSSSLWTNAATDDTRLARQLPDGTRIFVIPEMSGRPELPPRPAFCAANERRALDRRLRGEPRSVRREALQIFARQLEGQHESETTLAPVALSVHQEVPPALETSSSGEFVGRDAVSVYSWTSKRSAQRSRQSRSEIRPDGSRLLFLVPDGVASIDVAFPAGRSPSTGTFYLRTARRTARATNNVAVLFIDRPPSDADVWAVTWRSSTGSVVDRDQTPGLWPGSGRPHYGPQTERSRSTFFLSAAQ